MLEIIRVVFLGFIMLFLMQISGGLLEIKDVLEEDNE